VRECPERAVDVKPAALVARKVGERVQIVDGAGAGAACRPDDEERRLTAGAVAGGGRSSTSIARTASLPSPATSNARRTELCASLDA
jgi:hypothetical protein